MSDNLISSMGKMELDRVLPQAPAQSEPAVQPAAKQQAADKAAAATTQAESKAQERSAVEQKSAKTANPMTDVSLKFRVDAKTNEVSILILDRASHKVLRTIPPDEMNRMNPGELLELFT